MRGAGGTPGGIGTFFIGFIMMCVGFYMLLSAITVRSNLGFGSRMYTLPWGNFGVTTGMILVPFIFGVGMVFFDKRSKIGWLLTLGSLAAMMFSVIASVNLSMRSMTAFELITILVLAVGGLGLFLRSLR